MVVIPVIDVLNGQVVRGIAGRRSEYAPLISRLTSRTDPISVALALRESFGFRTCYVADLDGILHSRPNLALYRQFAERGFTTLVDSGVRGPEDAIMVLNSGATRVIAGLETCDSPKTLARMVDALPDLIFSLDLQQGLPRRPADSVDWSVQAQEIAKQVISARVRSILVLDLADVGTGTGGSTDALCQTIRRNAPGTTIIAGGGVRELSDLRRLQTVGVDEVLVASALHDGRLTRDEIETIQNDVDKVGSAAALGS